MISDKNAPARFEDMKEFAETLKKNPATRLKFFQDAGILDEKGKLTPQYHDDWLDEDGYPTEAALNVITHWPWNTSGWFEFIKEIWWMPDWGWREDDVIRDDVTDSEFDKPRHRYYISTGGWSGNESIIRAMTDNWFLWDWHWVQSRRGGHYIFESRDYFSAQEK